MKIDRAAGGTQVFENAVVSDGPERTGTHFHVDVAVSGTDKAGILLVHYEVDTAFGEKLGGLRWIITQLEVWSSFN